MGRKMQAIFDDDNKWAETTEIRTNQLYALYHFFLDVSFLSEIIKSLTILSVTVSLWLGMGEK